MTRQVIQKVGTLWKMLCEQQSVYRTVMKREIPGGLRNLCGKGYMIASVCMKEILTMYNDIRYAAQEEELPLNPAPEEPASDLPEDCPGEKVTDYLRKRQADLIKRYLLIQDYFDRDEEYLRLLVDHIFVLRRLGGKLRKSRQSERRSEKYYVS